MAAQSTIERLPAELKLKILSHLTVRELRAARSINRHFKALIELPANRRRLLDPRRDQLLARLDKVIQYYVYYDSSVTILEGLRRFFANRGLWIDDEGRKGDLREFNEYWSSYARVARDIVERFTDYIFALHFRTHFPDRAPAFNPKVHNEMIPHGTPLPPIDAFINPEHLRVEASDLRHYAELVKDTPGGYFPTEDMRPDEVEVDGMSCGSPLWPLTEIEWNGFLMPDLALRKHMQGILTVEDLVAVLQYPEIPSPPFAYCVRTGEVYHMLKKAVKERRYLARAQELQVLEEVFIY